MEVQEYEGAYYQVKDEVIESLPLKMDDDTLLE